MNEKTMTIADVALALGLSDVQVRRLDEELKPTRVGKIKMRLYKPEAVERLRKEREKKARARAS